MVFVAANCRCSDVGTDGEIEIRAAGVKVPYSTYDVARQ